MFYNNETAKRRQKMSCTTSKISEDINEIFITKIVQEVNEESKVLDIGTGNGFVLKEVRKKTLYEPKLIGIDSSESLIAENKDPSIELIVGNNYNLPFEDDTFDIVTAKNVTRFSSDEVYRVLKKGGKFIFREYGKYKGLVEISEMFKNRLIRSRDIEFYLKKLEKSGFLNIEYQMYLVKREYRTSDDIINIIQSFPYIKNLEQKDLEKVRNYIESDPKNLTITSDPFILEAEK